MKKTMSVLMLSIFVFMSCSEDKSIDVPTNDLSLLSSEANRDALAKALSNHLNSNGNVAARGTNFIMPFMMEESIGGFNPATGDFVNFSSTLNDQDFYRENNDGTVSVHVNSNKALVEYLNFYTGSYAYDERGHHSANYTGPVVEFPILDEFGNVIFVIKFVDQNEASIISMHGKGNVYNEVTDESNIIKLNIVKNKKGYANSEISIE